MYSVFLENVSEKFVLNGLTSVWRFLLFTFLLYIVGNRKISNGTNLFRHQAEPSVKNICLQKLYNYKNIYFSKSLFLTSSFKP